MIADIHAENAASRRVAEKIGLVEVGPIEHGGIAAFRYVGTRPR